MKRYQEKGVRLLFRADAAFAKPEVYEYLESRDTGYAMRLPANEVLQWKHPAPTVEAARKQAA